MKIENLFQQIPVNIEHEIFQQMFNGNSFRVDRIISKGHVTPAQEWYDQNEHEWVVLLKGAAKLLFEKENKEYNLQEGDTLHIPAHVRHRVSWTDPDQETIWLAIHYL